MAFYTFDQTVADMVRDDMADVTKQLLRQLENLNIEADKALADWDDGAYKEYVAAKMKWDAAAARMPGSLNSAETALFNITRGYLQVEHTGMNAWGQVSIK